MDDDAVLDMEADAPRQREALAVAPEAAHLGRGVEVFHLDHLLMDDRARIELLGGIVAGGADKLDAAVVRLAVGISSGEGREERVVDVDDAVEVLLAEPRREDLHVAAEDAQLAGDIADRVADLPEGGFLAGFIRRNGKEKKGDPLLFHGGAERLVV